STIPPSGPALVAMARAWLTHLHAGSALTNEFPVTNVRQTSHFELARTAGALTQPPTCTYMVALPQPPTARMPCPGHDGGVRQRRRGKIGLRPILADIGRRADEDLAIEIRASHHTITAAEPCPTISASAASHPPNQPTCTPT